MKTTLTGEVVAQAMRERHGRISGWEQLTEGEVSQAFAFRADGRDLVARVGPRREGFDKDAWAARRMPKPDVPVPEVLEVGELDEGVYCCVSERMGGVHLETYEEARELAPAVRAVIDAIAAADLSASEGFGSFDPETEHGPHAIWAGHLRSLLPETWDDLDGEADTALAEDLTAIAIGTAEALPATRRLVHGDLNPRNFTVEGGRVVGVFDWEAAVVGDPVWEVARYLLWAPMLPSTRAQAEYDLDRLSAEPGIAERMRSLVIVNGLWALDFYRRQGRTDAMELMLNRVHGFREDPPDLVEGRDGYWMRLLKPGTRRTA
ncbi:aminoglycoside phosphotransferase family protein [Glycomyces sp. A-F 0318]|uniref:phosphotransferase family protein n=1 Tax=Glycomyces amatae TaxID=2881355 RepID=UPI001E33DC65|nr:aminoglycoside phosphotransferase family protein [Glycomyces amatae]MCD0446973.1 aminoglycoside phosphotransferase family protein [Glycomyces amatae]